MKRFFVLLVCLSGLSVSLFAQETIPPAKGFVNDYAGVITSSQASQLNALLVHYAESSSNEIAVAVLSLPPEEILEQYTLKVAEAWGVGGTQNDNGILIAVYPEARKMRIEVGYGLEGAVPDVIALQIQENIMRPAFRAGDYYSGLRDAVEALIAATNGEYEDATTRTYYRRTSPSSGGDGGQILVILTIIILFSILSNRGGGKGGNGGRRRGGGLWMPWIFLSGNGGGSDWGGGSGFGGGGFGGGGFGGFGGGGFGGGGASSSW